MDSLSDHITADARLLLASSSSSPDHTQSSFMDFSQPALPTTVPHTVEAAGEEPSPTTPQAPSSSSASSVLRKNNAHITSECSPVPQPSSTAHAPCKPPALASVWLDADCYTYEAICTAGAAAITVVTDKKRHQTAAHHRRLHLRDGTASSSRVGAKTSTAVVCPCTGSDVTQLIPYESVGHKRPREVDSVQNKKENDKTRSVRRHAECAPVVEDGGPSTFSSSSSSSLPSSFPSQPHAVSGARRTSVTAAETRAAAAWTEPQDADAQLDILEEVELCTIVPQLPRTFGVEQLVLQVVPCTAYLSDHDNISSSTKRSATASGSNRQGCLPSRSAPCETATTTAAAERQKCLTVLRQAADQHDMALRWSAAATGARDAVWDLLGASCTSWLGGSGGACAGSRRQPSRLWSRRPPSIPSCMRWTAGGDASPISGESESESASEQRESAGSGDEEMSKKDRKDEEEVAERRDEEHHRRRERAACGAPPQEKEDAVNDEYENAEAGDTQNDKSVCRCCSRLCYTFSRAQRRYEAALATAAAEQSLWLCNPLPQDGELPPSSVPSPPLTVSPSQASSPCTWAGSTAVPQSPAASAKGTLSASSVAQEGRNPQQTESMSDGHSALAKETDGTAELSDTALDNSNFSVADAASRLWRSTASYFTPPPGTDPQLSDGLPLHTLISSADTTAGLDVGGDEYATTNSSSSSSGGLHQSLRETLDEAFSTDLAAAALTSTARLLTGREGQPPQQQQHHHHAVITRPAGAVVEWSSGVVSYTADTMGLMQEQQARAQRFFHLPPPRPSRQSNAEDGGRDAEREGVVAGSGGSGAGRRAEDRSCLRGSVLAQLQRLHDGRCSMSAHCHGSKSLEEEEEETRKGSGEGRAASQSGIREASHCLGADKQCSEGAGGRRAETVHKSLDVHSSPSPCACYRCAPLHLQFAQVPLMEAGPLLRYVETLHQTSIPTLQHPYPTVRASPSPLLRQAVKRRSGDDASLNGEGADAVGVRKQEAAAAGQRRNAEGSKKRKRGRPSRAAPLPRPPSTRDRSRRQADPIELVFPSLAEWFVGSRGDDVEKGQCAARGTLQQRGSRRGAADDMSRRKGGVFPDHRHPVVETSAAKQSPSHPSPSTPQHELRGSASEHASPPLTADPHTSNPASAATAAPALSWVDSAVLDESVLIGLAPLGQPHRLRLLPPSAAFAALLVQRLEEAVEAAAHILTYVSFPINGFHTEGTREEDEALRDEEEYVGEDHQEGEEEEETGADADAVRWFLSHLRGDGAAADTHARWQAWLEKCYVDALWDAVRAGLQESELARLLELAASSPYLGPPSSPPLHTTADSLAASQDSKGGDGGHQQRLAPVTSSVELFKNTADSTATASSPHLLNQGSCDTPPAQRSIQRRLLQIRRSVRHAARQHAAACVSASEDQTARVVLAALVPLLHRRITVMFELLRHFASKSLYASHRAQCEAYQRWYACTPSPAAVLRLLQRSSRFSAALARCYPQYSLSPLRVGTLSSPPHQQGGEQQREQQERHRHEKKQGGGEGEEAVRPSFSSTSAASAATAAQKFPSRPQSGAAARVQQGSSTRSATTPRDGTAVPEEAEKTRRRRRGDTNSAANVWPEEEAEADDTHYRNDDDDEEDEMSSGGEASQRESPSHHPPLVPLDPMMTRAMTAAQAGASNKKNKGGGAVALDIPWSPLPDYARAPSDRGRTLRSAVVSAAIDTPTAAAAPASSTSRSASLNVTASAARKTKPLGPAASAATAAFSATPVSASEPASSPSSPSPESPSTATSTATTTAGAAAGSELSGLLYVPEVALLDPRYLQRFAWHTHRSHHGSSGSSGGGSNNGGAAFRSSSTGNASSPPHSSAGGGGDRENATRTPGDTSARQRSGQQRVVSVPGDYLRVVPLQEQDAAIRTVLRSMTQKGRTLSLWEIAQHVQTHHSTTYVYH